MSQSRFSRYYETGTIRQDNRISLEQRLIINAEPLADSIKHTLIANETLEMLAKHYYGREDLWWRIADANPPRFPLEWKAGDSVIIPPIHLATSVVAR